jgi:hypothetical protein
VNLLFSAFQIPGCVKEINPTTITLKRGLLYQRVKRETDFAGASFVDSTSGSRALSDILKTLANDILADVAGLSPYTTSTSQTVK